MHCRWIWYCVHVNNSPMFSITHYLQPSLFVMLYAVASTITNRSTAIRIGEHCVGEHPCWPSNVVVLTGAHSAHLSAQRTLQTEIHMGMSVFWHLYQCSFDCCQPPQLLDHHQLHGGMVFL